MTWRRQLWCAVLGVVGACGAPGLPELPPAALVDLEDLEAGDASCPHGGVRVLTGRDDGDGDGVAGDGVLQPGEVDEAREVCEPAPAVVPPEPTWRSLTPPDGPDGTAVVDLSGGRGERGDGGDAGRWTAEQTRASPFGHVAVFTTGTPSPAPELPSPGEVDLGSLPLEVAADLVVEERAVDDPPAVGTVWLRRGATLLTYEDGQGGRTITGLRVHPGATLTLPAGDTAPRTLILRLGVVLEGRLVLGPGANRDLALTTSTFVAAPGSEVDLSGADGGPDTPGGDGGAFRLTVGTTGTEVPFAVGVAWLEGRIDTSGGDGLAGGDGAEVTVRAPGLLVWTGDVVTRGGRAQGDGDSGDAGAVQLAGGGLVLAHGEVDASGGSDGRRGGRGGSIDVAGVRVDSRATYRSDGGDADPRCEGACPGGAGGAIGIAASGSGLVHDGRVEARGGEGTGTSGRGADGGRGGTFELEAFHAPGGARLPGDDVEVAGDVLLTGGPGSGSGGAGGVFKVALSSSVEADASVRLLGYARLDARGGVAAGTGVGGDGGRLDLMCANVEVEGMGLAGGGLASHVAANLTGGTGRQGGAGGAVSLQSNVGPGERHPDRVLRLAGDLDLDGGDGGATGGTSGTVSLSATHDVVLEAEVSAAAGASPAGDGPDAARAYLDEPGVAVTSTGGEIAVRGALRLRGGDGSEDGGRAGFLVFEGLRVVIAGTIEAVGGYGGAGRGGRGGFVDLVSRLPPSSVTGTIRVPPGDGTVAPGSPGQVWIDGAGGPTDEDPVEP